MSPDDVFSATYAEARERFLAAASAHGLTATASTHPSAGSEGETLAIDVALEGPADAEKLLIVSSGTHGVEGFSGSAAQLFALAQDDLRRAAEASGVAVLYLHAINPFGFSHLRRVTQENVDLNRNFQDFSRPLPENRAYQEVRSLLLPKRWPAGPANLAALGWYIATRGLRTLQDAVSGGQYDDPTGLFFGGTAPCWSHRAVREILRTHGARAKRIAWIDLHTGLGRPGTCECVFGGRADDAAALARARAWWGGSAGVKTLDGGGSVSSPVTGQMLAIGAEVCPSAEVTPVYLEFGTKPLWHVFTALRAEQWLARQPSVPAHEAAPIKHGLRDAFTVQGEDARAFLLRRTVEAMRQSLRM